LKRLVNNFEEYVCVFFFLLIFILMSMQVFTRYLLGITFAWNEEMARYVFVWLTFVGAAYACKQDAHIKIEIGYEFINRRLPRSGQIALQILKQLLTIGFLLQLIYFGYILADRSWRFRSQAMQIPQFYLYISVVIGAALFLVRELQAIGRRIKTDISAIPGKE
jgi:TRAP-type C4-dicarboxylate transport system permease small subunit